MEHAVKGKEPTRARVTKWIREKRCRQEFPPLIGRFISCASPDPLHLKNNVCKEMFAKISIVASDESESSGLAHLFQDIPVDDSLSVFASLIKAEMRCNQLYKKYIKFYNESAKHEMNSFGQNTRFRGIESYRFLESFPKIIQHLLTIVTKPSSVIRLHQIFYQCILLRHLVSYSVRILNWSSLMLNDFCLLSRKHFIALCKFDLNVTPSSWTLTNVAPQHCQQIYNQFSVGLGINTMEARENKHLHLKKYMKNSQPQKKWSSAFLHEFAQSVYLTENGHDRRTYRKTRQEYLPEPKDNKCYNCGLYYTENRCNICSSDLISDIESEVNLYL